MAPNDSPGSNASLGRQIFVAALVAVPIVALTGASARQWTGAGGLYPWKAALLFAAAMTVLARCAHQHPFPTLGPANRVTVIRLALLALLAGLVGEPVGRDVAAASIGLTIVIAALDGLDGWLARRSGMASPFGARFDMETDALLVMVLSILIWRHAKAGAWILTGGLLRYAFVAAGWVLPWMAGPLPPTHRAKAAAVGYMIGLAVALAPIVSAAASAVVAGLSLVALMWSFALDVGRLWRQR